jgi:hypothetical protein
MMLPLFTVFTEKEDFDCYSSDDVRRVLRKLGEKDMFHRPPQDTKVFLFLSWVDVTKDFIKG